MKTTMRWLALSGLLAACTDPRAPGPEGVSREEIKEFPLQGIPRFDVLFVIDDSPAMADAVATVATNEARWMDYLAIAGPMDLHVAVTTADGTGELRGQSCLHAFAPAWIHDASTFEGTTTIRNYDGTLRDVFACMAQVGTEGPAVRQPFESMQRAFVDHPGFHRADAVIYVVIVSSGDDCSLRDGVAAPSDPFACTEAALVCDETDLRAPGEKHHCRPRTGSPLVRDVDEYADFLRTLAPYAEVAAVVGPDAPVIVDGGPTLAPSCLSPTATAQPAMRTAALAAAFPVRTNVTLCDEDLTPAVSGLGFRSGSGIPCFEGEIDVDPSTPGIQADCAVTLVRDRRTDHEQETVVPSCDPLRFTSPCWRIRPDEVDCGFAPTPAYLDLDFGEAPIPTGLWVRASCTVE